MKPLFAFLLLALCACSKTHTVVPAGMPENIYKDEASFLTALSMTVPGLEIRFFTIEKNLAFGLFYSPARKKYIVAIVHARLPDNAPVASGEMYAWRVKSIKTGRDVSHLGDTILVKYGVYNHQIRWKGFGNSLRHFLLGGFGFERSNFSQEYELDLGEWVTLNVPEKDVEISGHSNFSEGDFYNFSASMDPLTGRWIPKISLAPAPPVAPPKIPRASSLLPE